MDDAGSVRAAPRRDRVRFTLCSAATILFALALVADAVSGLIPSRCPPGWTSWDFAPGLDLIVAIPLTLLLLVSGVATLRARRAPPRRRGGPFAARVPGALLSLLATVVVSVFAYGLVVQVVNPTSGCITF